MLLNQEATGEVIKDLGEQIGSVNLKAKLWNHLHPPWSATLNWTLILMILESLSTLGEGIPIVQRERSRLDSM
jgi:hypothetical protein